jgi:tetratricopeptide (TPR) repeat protein
MPLRAGWRGGSGVSNRLASRVERFVGRTRELRQLAAACAAAADGRGSLTVVSGEAGIGKTRFCEEVTDRASQLDLTVVTARCWVEGGAPALWPWQPILDELCGDGDGAAELLASEAGPPVADRDRFTRFAAVTDRLAEVCARSPVCLVIDDVHGADPGTLLLIRFVARSLQRMSLALVLTRRSSEPSDDDAKTQLLDDIEREATPLVLPQFDLDETTTFLAADGLVDLDADLTLALHQVTGGNPLFLRRVAALGMPGPDDSLPGGLQVAIEQALARLGAETQRILRASSVLLVPAPVAIAAEVAETDPLSMVDAVSEAATTGLVSIDGTDRLAFSHELIRLALEETLTAAERLDAHARAASAVAGHDPIPPECLGRRAHHALVAAPRSVADARGAVSACEEAADSMVRSFAYEQADTLLAAAVELYESPRLGSPSARLLGEWAHAALRCGRITEARRRFDRAVTAAQREGDAALFAEAALGLGGHWVNEYRAPMERARVLGLQRSALAGLPARYTALRCRLESRLAAEAVFDGEPIEPVYAALDSARRCGDPLALAEALSLSHHVLFTPEHAHRRLELADELVRVASEAGYGVLGLMGLCWRAADLFCLGDERAVAALEDLRERANALASQHILYMVGVMDVMLLIRAGRLDEAEAEAGRCFELGEAIGEIDAFGYLSAHTFGIRWIQGRDTELLDMAEAASSSPSLVKAEFAFRAAAAAFTARAGHPERAVAQLEKLTGEGLARLPQSTTWLVGMTAIVDVASTVADAAIAREAYDLLLPYADLPTIGGVAVLCLGSTERVLGITARTFGDHDRAVGHLERAVAENRRLSHRPMVAVAQADLATTLSRRDRPGDRARAADLLEQAIAEADRMGMSARAEAWRDQRSALDESHDLPADRRGSPHHGEIRRDGTRWIVALDGHRVRIADLIGMTYLAELLTRPGQLIPALTLASQGSVPREPTRHELLDDEARAAYAARAKELTVDLAEAEANNDLVRAEQLRIELDALVDELEAATGLSGRPRTFTDPTERARTAVRKAIKRAIDVIDDANPVIAEALRTSITTGATCSYTPDPHDPVTWSTRQPDHDDDSVRPSPPPGGNGSGPSATLAQN